MSLAPHEGRRLTLLIELCGRLVDFLDVFRSVRLVHSIAQRPLSSLCFRRELSVQRPLLVLEVTLLKLLFHFVQFHLQHFTNFLESKLACNAMYGN